MDVELPGIDGFEATRQTRANETLNSILNTATGGIYMINRDGYIPFMNQSTCTMFEDEAIGTHISSMSADIETLSRPEAFKLHINQVIRKQPGVRRDDEGGIYIGIFHDISRRKAYESELKKTRKKLRAMNDKPRHLDHQADQQVFN